MEWKRQSFALKLNLCSHTMNITIRDGLECIQCLKWDMEYCNKKISVTVGVQILLLKYVVKN